MNEKKDSKKPLIVYYIIALIVVMLLNALLFPQIQRYSVKEVAYSEFLTMLDEGKIESVQIEDREIAFTPVEQLEDGSTVSLQAGMPGIYPFLDEAFAGWCRQTEHDPENCSFHDPANTCYFPPVEEL